MPTVTLRDAEAPDAEAVNDIAGHYVVHSTATYHTELWNVERRIAWLAERTPEHPVIVAEQEGSVVGWGSLRPFDVHCGYDRTVENSVWLRPECTGRGIGSMLLAELIRRARQHQMHVIVARVDSEQTASLALHRKFGFEETGTLRQVGRKFDRWLDVVYLQLVLD